MAHPDDVPFLRFWGLSTTGRQRWRRLAELWLILAEVAVGVASLAAPSYLSVPYAVLALAVVIAWSFRWQLRTGTHLLYERGAHK